MGKEVPREAASASGQVPQYILTHRFLHLPSISEPCGFCFLRQTVQRRQHSSRRRGAGDLTPRRFQVFSNHPHSDELIDPARARVSDGCWSTRPLTHALVQPPRSASMKLHGDKTRQSSQARQQISKQARHASIDILDTLHGTTWQPSIHPSERLYRFSFSLSR